MIASGVVDDQIHAGDGLQGADVAALTADDPALHLVVGQVDHGNRRLGGVVGGAALDGGGDDLSALLLRLVLELLLDLLDLLGGLMAHVLLDGIQQELLGLLLGQAGDLFQSLQLLLADLLGLRLGLLNARQTAVQLVLLALKGLGLLVQGGFLLLQTALLLGQLRPALLDFLVVFCARFMDLILGLQQHFLLPIFAGADRLVDKPGGLLLRGADGTLGDTLAVQHTAAKACRDAQDGYNNGNNPNHNSCSTPPS